MSSTYTPSLTLTQIGNGEQSGTWGTTTNNNWQLIEDAVAGVATVTVSGTSGATLSVANGASDQARKAVIVVTGSTSGTNAIVAPLEPKVYIISNQTSGGFPITIGASTGSVVTIPNGLTTLVYCDGTNFNSGITGFTGGNLSITGTINATGTITAPVINASLYGGAFGNIPVQLGSSSTGYISAPPSSGSSTFLAYTPGTGFNWQTSSTTASNINGGGANQLVYQTNAGSTSFISAPSGSNQVLQYNGSQILWASGGAVSAVSATLPLVSSGGTAPTISLSGVVPVANGGTGSASQNFVDLTTTQTIGGNKTFTGTTTAPAYNFSAHSSIYGGTGGVTIAADNGSGGYYNTIQIVNNGKSVDFGNGTYIAPNWGFVSSLNNIGTAGVAGIFDATGYAGSNALSSCINSTSSNYVLWGYGSALNTLVTTGAVTPNGTTGVNYTSVSDRRLKSNISDFTNSGTTIDALKPRTFTWTSTGQSDIGFIADEFQQIIPNAVNGSPDAVDEEGKPKYQSIDCSTPEMIALLVAEVQSLRKRVAALEAK